MTNDTIAALATPAGQGAIGIIRVSGKNTIPVINSIFKGKDLAKATSHTIHLGTIYNNCHEIIDEVLISIFKAPHSYTREDVIEISCHGSQYILQKVLDLLLSKGMRLAKPGEFTQRAFLNGRFDLSQAEAVADLIASENYAMQQIALNQMRGGFSGEISKLRNELLHFASLIELELDFSEEDVAFADRQALLDLIEKIQTLLQSLMASFKYGNAIKNGIPIVIAGKPNTGKSTLLNALLNEEKAIVSDVPGTTRDFIEDQVTLEGVVFRFIDTAGIRKTSDKVESVGVQRTHEKMQQASLVIYLIDLAHDTADKVNEQLKDLKKSDTPYLLTGNKADVADGAVKEALKSMGAIFISAKNKTDLDKLTTHLKSLIPHIPAGSSVAVANARHMQALVLTKEALDRVAQGLLSGLFNDLVAHDLRSALFHLGEITGEITTDDLLDTIFSKFCIGK